MMENDPNAYDASDPAVIMLLKEAISICRKQGLAGQHLSAMCSARDSLVKANALIEASRDLVGTNTYKVLTENPTPYMAQKYIAFHNALTEAISDMNGDVGAPDVDAPEEPIPAVKPRCDGCHFGRVESVMDTVYKYFFGGAWAHDTGEKKPRQWVECQLEPRIVLKQCDSFCRHYKDALTK